MTKGLKRILSMVIAIVMVVGMVPTNVLHVHAAEAEYSYHPDKLNGLPNQVVVNANNSDNSFTTDSAGNAINIPVGSEWANPVIVEIADDVECLQGKIKHTHNDDCYDKELACTHVHVQDCYTNYEQCSTFGIGCSHAFHYTTGSWLSTKSWGSSTLGDGCPHGEHTPYGQTNSCYQLTTTLGEGCPTRSWRNGNVLEGDYGGWQFYEHDHSEPACYQYTWTLQWKTYNVTVAVSGKDGVSASGAPATVTHGQDVSFTLPAMGDIGWVATVEGGTQTTSVALSATEATTVTVTDVTTGDIKVTLSRKTIYTVTLVPNDTIPAYGTASVDVAKGVDGTTVTVTATPKAKETNAVYKLETIKVNGTVISGNTFQINGANANVEVTFTKIALTGNTTANIEIDPDDVLGDLDALKQEIFNKLAVQSVPAGVTYDQLKYEHKYWSTYTIAGEQIGETTQTNNYAELDVDPADKDETLGYTTNHPFGYRGLNTVEHVRLTYKLSDGTELVIEADVTLVHNCTPGAAADCENDQKCTVCGKVLVTATGHNYTGVVTAPTCTEAGYTTYTCSKCGGSYTEAGDAVLGHITGETKIENDTRTQECGATGTYDEVVYCGRCLTHEISRLTKQAAGGHNYANEIERVPATCTVAGHYTLQCSCGATNEYPLSATGHGQQGYEYVKVDNQKHNVVCKECGVATGADDHTFVSHQCICEAIETYTITFNNWDGSKIWSGAVEYGTVPAAPTGFAVPINHSFAGWNNTVAAVAGETTYTATYKLVTNTTGQVFINGYLANADKLTGLKAKVLVAAGLPTDSNFTVYMVTGSGNINVESTGYSDLFNMYIRFNVGDSQSFIIVHNDTQAQGNITVSVKDNRLVLSITAENLSVSGKNEPADLLAQIKGKVTITATNPETGAVTNIPVEDSYIDMGSYAWPADGQNGTYTVTVKVNSAANDTYSNAPTANLTLTCTDTTILYNITWDINGNKQTVQVAENTMPTEPTATREYYTFNGWDKTVVVATKDTTYTAIWKPTNDKNNNNNPDELDTFTVRFEYNGKVKEFTGKKLGDTVSFTPDAADAPAGQYFAGWDREVVAVKAEDAATGTCVITYTATWDAKCTVTIVYGNGTADGSELIVPGGTINLANPNFDQHIFDGWYVDGVKVAMPYTVNNSVTVTAKWLTDMDRDNVEDGTAGDPYWTVTVDGTVVGTTTLNGEYDTPAVPADQKNMFFVKWNKVEDSANHTITFTAVWNTNDSNDNNKDDANETITVTQNGGTVTVNGATANGTHIYDSTKSAHTIIITPVKNYYVKSLKINGNAFDIQPKSASVAYNNGVLTLSNVTLTNGMTIEVEYAKHKIPAVSEPSMKVNGHIDEKVTSVTKKTVLEAILGKTLTDAEVDQYEVKMYVNLGEYLIIGKIEGYYDIWKLTAANYGDEINAALKSALAKAVDVGGTESFEITWKAHDQFPAVTERITVKLEEARTPTKVVHNGDTYTAGSMNDALLEEIKADLSSPNSTISQVVWADNSSVIFQAGETVTLKVTVTVLEDANVYGTTHTVAVTVNVPYTQASIVVPATGNLIYNTGMTDADKVAMVLQVLNPQITPALPTGMTPTVWYLASEARNVDMTINFSQMDLGIYSMIVKNLLGDSITIQIPVDNMWLNIGDDLTIPEMPSNERIEWILMNDLIPNYGADFVSGQLSSDQMATILANTLKKYPDIAEYYKYLGAHQFGEAEQEKVYVSVSDYGYGAATSNISVLNLTDTRAESEIKLNSGVVVTYNGYTEAELLALILDGVYANGQKIDGLTVEFVTDVTGLPVADASEVTVKFAGNKDYKPSTATIAIKINKATVSVSVDNRLFKWQAGQFYGINDVVSTNPAGVDTINFVAGLNLNGVNLDGGVKGFVAQVQLLLPDELQALLESANGRLQAAGLDISFADGASMKLSELKNAVDALDGIVAGSEYEEYFRVLLNMLSSLPTEVADIEIIIGGKMPTDIGTYVVGAISADANYTTDFGVGAVVIYPDGTKVDLAWNQNDENYVITNTLLSSGAFDTGAHAIKVYDDRFTLEQATEQVAEIFLGVDIDGNITLEMDQSKLNVGAYVEVAMIVQLGNEMFYSEPLVRPIVVVAETLDVDFVDSTGAVNNERHYEFFNIPQNGMEGNLLITYKKDGNGYKAGDKVTGYSVKYFYVGVQTNGVPYASQEAPVHAGVYTITAMVTVRDNTGYITHAGQGIGALVIEPSKSTIDVENGAIKWDGNEHTFNQYVTAGSVNVPAITPDTTVITAGINADLDANIGLSAINGTVNVDMPSWLDNLMNKLGILEAGYADGITVTEFKAYVEKIKTGLAELGFDSEAFDKIVSVIDQLDGNVVLTFHDNKGYKEVGVYLVIGIVTDSDHYPSADAGLVVIYPDATKVELQFNETWDDNNVFTWAYLQSYDLNAKAYQPGTNTEIPAATDKVINLFVGFADHGELEFTSNKAELDNGVYAQVAFVLDLSNKPYYAEPIAREVIIVPNNADIDFVDEDGKVNNDRHFEFNNKPHTMNTIRVTLVDGTVLNLTVEDSRVDIFYVGVQSNGQPYASYDAPVNTGVYQVTAQYTERDAQGRVIHLGVGIGTLVIEASKSNVTVDNDAFPYGEAHKVNDLVHASSVNVPGLTPDTTIISAGLSANLDNITGLNAINGTVNIDLPVWMDSVMNKLNILDAGYADGISAEVFLSYADKIRNGMDELGVDTVAFDKIISLVKQLPISTNLTFTDDIAYSEIGAYLVVAIVTDSDHYPSMDAGILVIYSNVSKAELKWNYRDANNIITRAVLAELDMAASAYVKDAFNEENTNRISYMVFGIGSDGSISLISDPAAIKNLPNGVYTEVAYIYQNIDATMTLAIPIVRTFTIAEHNVDVIFQDVKVTYDGKSHGVNVTVKDRDQNVIDDPSNVTITYINLGTNYYSTTAPTEVGSYTVVVKYEKYINGDRAFFGMEVGNVTIKPADADYILSDKTVECGDISAINGMITNTNNLPYAIYIIKNTAKGEVDVILPAGWKVTLPVGAGVDALIAEIEKLPAVIENTKLISTLKSVLNSIDMQKLTVNGAQPSTCGEYDITVIAFGNKNYNIAQASAVLTIEHADDEDKDHNCDACGKKDIEGHTPGDEANCTAAQICTECGAELNAMLGHTEVVDPAVDATCTTTGLTEGKHCSVCNEVLVEQQETPVTEHSYDEDGVCGCGAAAPSADTEQNRWWWWLVLVMILILVSSVLVYWWKKKHMA